MKLEVGVFATTSYDHHNGDGKGICLQLYVRGQRVLVRKAKLRQFARMLIAATITDSAKHKRRTK